MFLIVHERRLVCCPELRCWGPNVCIWMKFAVRIHLGKSRSQTKTIRNQKNTDIGVSGVWEISPCIWAQYVCKKCVQLFGQASTVCCSGFLSGNVDEPSLCHTFFSYPNLALGPCWRCVLGSGPALAWAQVLPGGCTLF